MIAPVAVATGAAPVKGIAQCGQFLEDANGDASVALLEHAFKGKVLFTFEEDLAASNVAVEDVWTLSAGGWRGLRGMSLDDTRGANGSQ